MMTPELNALALLGLLHAALFVAMSVSANRLLPASKTLGTREAPLEHELTGKTGRIYRALRNNTENLGFFAAAVVVVQLSGANSGFTATCAWLTLATRIAYVPAYVFGWVPWRSLIFTTGFGTTTLMFVAALL
ncbi:MAPEG family protein [Pseudoruegeria sp. SHC-113]|uniref:MAPEG family protein n=1 Tax=Pseudoruegeria sp. SHC-113 TaxID=2855439 RepID=UPI0021BBA914|nr:MAPEG family protein [Pseudoruegeria sp. SHC-113]